MLGCDVVTLRVKLLRGVRYVTVAVRVCVVVLLNVQLTRHGYVSGARFIVAVLAVAILSATAAAQASSVIVAEELIGAHGHSAKAPHIGVARRTS